MGLIRRGLDLTRKNRAHNRSGALRYTGKKYPALSADARRLTAAPRFVQLRGAASGNFPTQAGIPAAPWMGPSFPRQGGE